MTALLPGPAELETAARKAAATAARTRAVRRRLADDQAITEPELGLLDEVAAELDGMGQTLGAIARWAREQASSGPGPTRARAPAREVTFRAPPDLGEQPPE